jgi:hypothetical protein
MVIKKEHIDKAKERVKMHSHAIKSEFKKQTSTAIMAAFGLIIALAWKDVITALVGKLNISGNATSALSLTVSALILTAISVIGILLISKWAKSGEEK